MELVLGGDSLDLQLMCDSGGTILDTEAEFLDVIGTKVFLIAVHRHLYYRI